MNKTIPIDWKETKLGKYVKIFNGGAFSSSDATDNGAKWLKIANAGIGRIKWDDKSFLPNDFLESHKKYRLKSGDIILALTRPTLGNHLKIAEISEEDENSLLNQRVGKILCSKELNKKLAYYFLRTEEAAYRINQQLTGTDPPNLSSKAFNYISFFLPPTPEQNCIVAVLETWDKSIEALTQKIQLKKNIKKGLMQELLTGKKRLSGFSGEWKNHEIGDLLDYEQPQKYIVESDQYDASYETPVLTAGKSFILGYTKETDGICKNLPVIIFDDFTTANKFVDFEFKVKSSAMKLLRSKDNGRFNVRFIYERMQLINFTVGEHKRKYLSEYQYLSVKLPNIDEQNAITKILTTADNQITTLEQKKQKLEDQKKYLLNSLITGQIRTPENLTMNNQ